MQKYFKGTRFHMPSSAAYRQINSRVRSSSKLYGLFAGCWNKIAARQSRLAKKEIARRRIIKAARRGMSLCACNCCREMKRSGARIIITRCISFDYVNLRVWAILRNLEYPSHRSLSSFSPRSRAAIKGHNKRALCDAMMRLDIGNNREEINDESV